MLFCNKECQQGCPLFEEELKECLLRLALQNSLGILPQEIKRELAKRRKFSYMSLSQKGAG